MSKLIFFFWFMSLLTFLAVLLYCYASLAEVVFYSGNPMQQSGDTISREGFFYFSLGTGVLVNLVFFAFFSWIKKRQRSHNMHFTQPLSTWSLGFAGSINIFLMLGMYMITLFNSVERVSLSLFKYALIFWIGVVVIMVIGLPLILINKKFSTS